ncbi:hypothetical protein B9Z55_027814 [Caenorhabditis nigoni]|uniref:SPK domain-containing protein n=1 Tax=Caenorhabditis nigoni TaxID=1611254 RepID=A0A2G5SEG2_9PELO|nr:hypothetical protein B9Z55_027814 [Caenorhabditis nigoni]
MAPRNDECEKAIKFISNGIKNCTEPESFERWCESARTEAGYDKSAHSFHFVIRSRLDRIEHLKGYSLKEKVHLVFIFSRPVSDVFVKELKSNKCVVELNDKRKITYFRSPDGDYVLQSEQDSNPSKRKFKGEPILKKKRKAVTQVTSLDNVQDPPDTPANNQKQENKASVMKKEINRNTPTKQKSNLNTEEDVDVMNESIQQEAPFNGRIDYDDMDNGEYPEFMVPANDESPNRLNKKHQNLSQENEYSRFQNIPFNGKINYEELDKQKLDVATYLKQERSFDRKPEKRHQNSWSSENAKKVKIEEWDEDFFAAPEALNNPEEQKISVLLLANDIGITALYCSLEEVQKKALQAIEIIKMEEREITLNVADFNSFIDSMLKSIKRSRIRYSRQTEKLLPLKTIYKHIKLSLILPFGPEIAGEALKIVDKEIEELRESRHEVPLETIRWNLEYLLNSSTGFWI